MDDGVIFVGRSNTLGKGQSSSDFSKMFTRLGMGAKAGSTEPESSANRLAKA
jgi:hypothetical protein